MNPARIDSSALNSSLKRLAEQGKDSDLYVSLHHVIDASGQLFAVDGGGLMLADDSGELRYVIASNPTAQRLEDIQIETGEGPCVDAFMSEQVTVSADVANDDRYPVAGPQISAQGIGAVLGLPVRLSGLPIGSLDIYVDHPYEFDQSEIAALTRYGEVVEAMVQAAVAASHAGRLADQLSYALDYRAPIERGIGYLMARDQLGHNEAFHKLRSAARSSRRKIDLVTADLLSTGLLPGESSSIAGEGP